MAVTLANIKGSFPEFALTQVDGTTPDTAQDALITAKIAEAEAQVDRTIFANTANADVAIKYLTAHLLALSPTAVDARLLKKDGTTIYWPTFVRVSRAASFGYRVV